MQLNYLDAVSSVLSLMKQSKNACKTIDMHKTCYTELFRHLFNESIPFSMDAALDWLDHKKQILAYGSYLHYRNALFRLEHFLLFGDIDSPCCKSENFFFCRSGMSESFYYLTFELEEYYASEQNPSYYHTYSVAIKEFFRLATSAGIAEPENITVDILIEYWNTYCCTRTSLSQRRNAVCAMTALMKYLHKRGDVPECYSLILFGENADRLIRMKLSKTDTAAHPAIMLEAKVYGYLDLLGEWKYMESSMEFYRNDLNWYFMFLELNHIDHSWEAVENWQNLLSEYPDPQDTGYPIAARKLHTVKMFADYLEESLDVRALCSYKRECKFDALPLWSQNILSGFLNARKQDGMTASTLTMCRTVGSNFFGFLDEKGITAPGEITPDVVVAFHNQDFHNTPEGKNAYAVKLRQLIRYMADQDLVTPTLVFAVPTSYAARRNIVSVLSDEMVEKIYEYRNKASSPMELRDTAIVMLGLRMGIRGSDILKLQVNDFDWKRQTVTFIQQKTRKAITLPVPTDVGNSVYKYIFHGRPQSAEDGNGYIFIRHQAPYIPLKVNTACRGALKRILLEYGFTLSSGQGFHMTRKTFATRLLRADNQLDHISNALGHARKQTAEVYLERDEDKMRLCPLSFGGVLS